MNAESPLHIYAFPLTLAAIVGFPFLGLVLYGIVQTRRRDRTWRQVGHDLHLGGRGTVLTRPRMAGSYRGRALEAGHVGQYLKVTVRVANHARILDEVRSVAPLPDAPWLNAAARAELTSLAQGRGSHRRWWKVNVQGQAVTLTCLGTETNAESLRNMLDLACDLAEGVDAVAVLPILTDNSPPVPR